MTRHCAVASNHPRIPTCTYRLQFNRWFTFTQAREIVPYLVDLGVSDVYSAPYFQVSRESLHGYDITDHNKLNPSIGSRADYDAWIAELHAHEMGQVLDFVPNHVGIADERNVWWMDVLENGPSSRYTPYFDIDWEPLKTDLRNKVLLPILGDQYGRVLERGELQVHFEEGTFYLLCSGRRLPIAPGTYRHILEIALQNLAEYKDEDFYAELQSIITALEYLPKRTETEPKRITERVREKEIIKRRLERRCAEAPQVQQAIEKALTQINGKPGDARSFDALDELLNAQSYRLAFWRVAAEEILTGSKTLRKDWPVHGTTGYDFANQVTQLLVDSSAETAITKTFHRFIGHSIPYGHLLYAKKLQVMKLALANDVDVLGNMLDRLSEQNRWYRDFTLEALSRAVRETIACFPVYRTYLAPGQPGIGDDRHIVGRAISAAKRRNPGIDESIFNYLCDVLLLRFPPNLNAAERAAHTHFVLKFQQATGPIMAKGLEDTVFYIYNRLTGLNEVGGEPQQFGSSVETFHEWNLDRHRNWPASLLATSTHDTKRSEDVRARVVAISEIPELWRRSLQRWRMANRRWKRMISDLKAPDANEEYLLYQTLLGTWPMRMDGEPESVPTQEYVERIQAYMAKALHEAKINTSWIQPNEEWHGAMRDFVTKILEGTSRNTFQPMFLPVAKEFAQLGAINWLTLTLLKLIAPGVPDIYQGNEIWDYSLVDPDNRRPVDYNLRREMLDALPSATPDELMQTWPDGRMKLFLTQRVLRFRRQHADLFQRGEYLPLRASGIFSECCVSFVRSLADKWIVVISPRLSSRVGFPPIGELWKDTVVEMPETLSFKSAQDLFTGRPMPLKHRRVKLTDALSVLPFGVITNL